ncbi:MAG: RnfABCDGE type electron transport complex subunit G [Treponema sp.]|jgi:electron transport complex protein RnfG|nr:RnfABCDGE type electron transport complex subunit G [Treponema sp.]
MSGEKKASAPGVGTMFKLGAVLAAYAAAACVGLAFVYSGTAEVIEKRKQADTEAALKGLFAQADGFIEAKDIPPSADPSVTLKTLYGIKKGGQVIGAAVEASRGGYNGAVTVLAGVTLDGTVAGVRILSHTETPGLGANAASDSYYIDAGRTTRFYEQFKGKALGDPFEPGRDVTAITAATITSRAVSAAVKAAGRAGLDWLAAAAPVADAAPAAAAFVEAAPAAAAAPEEAAPAPSTGDAQAEEAAE